MFSTKSLGNWSLTSWGIRLATSSSIWSRVSPFSTLQAQVPAEASVQGNHFQAFNSSVINNLDGDAAMLSLASNGKDVPPRYASMRSSSISVFRFRARRAQPSSAPAIGKKTCLWIQAAAVIVGVQHPHGNLVLAARLHIPGLGVVVIKPLHAYLIFGSLRCLRQAAQL